jgi:hypothetical protein
MAAVAAAALVATDEQAALIAATPALTPVTVATAAAVFIFF